jgi:hypothetical protein
MVIQEMEAILYQPNSEVQQAFGGIAMGYSFL